jgi:TRAP-type C4-dicarboxylate transport system substrate-binding protein
MIREVGGIPVVIAAAETYTAFQRGIIDAVALSGPDIAAYRLYDIGSFYLRIGLSHTVLQWCLSPRAFDAMPDDLRHQLYALFRFRGQVANQNYYGGAALQSALDRLADNGVDVSDPTPAERAAWVAAVHPVERRFIEANEALGLPAAAFVAAAKERAARYTGWSNEQLWNHVAERPVPGIIDL